MFFLYLLVVSKLKSFLLVEQVLILKAKVQFEKLILINHWFYRQKASRTGTAAAVAAAVSKASVRCPFSCNHSRCGQAPPAERISNCKIEKGS